LFNKKFNPLFEAVRPLHNTAIRHTPGLTPAQSPANAGAIQEIIDNTGFPLSRELQSCWFYTILQRSRCLSRKI